MKKILLLVLTMVFAFTCALSASAAVKFASPFGDGMVLHAGRNPGVFPP